VALMAVGVATTLTLSPIVRRRPQHSAWFQRQIGMNIERTSRNAWIGLGIVLLLALAAFSAMGGGMLGHEPLVGYGARPFLGAGPWFWGFGLLGLAIRLAVWGLLIMFAVRLFRRSSARSDTYVAHPDSSSLEILKRRYAAGEITREQFEEMRQVLDQTAA
jgi:putative membrane protein